MSEKKIKPRNHWLFKPCRNAISISKEITFGLQIVFVLITGIVSARNTNLTHIKQGSIGATKTSAIKRAPDSVYIFGFIEDAKKHEAIPFADIRLESGDSVKPISTKQTIYDAISDIDGQFCLKIPKDFINKKLVLKCGYEGYKENRYEFIGNKSHSKIELKMVPDSNASHSKLTLIISCPTPFPPPDQIIVGRDDSPYMPPMLPLVR